MLLSDLLCRSGNALQINGWALQKTCVGTRVLLGVSVGTSLSVCKNAKSIFNHFF